MPVPVVHKKLAGPLIQFKLSISHRLLQIRGKPRACPDAAGGPSKDLVTNVARAFHPSLGKRVHKGGLAHKSFLIFGLLEHSFQLPAASF